MSHVRIKWMRLKLRTPLEALFSFIKNTPYNEEAGLGFTDFDWKDGKISATFNKKNLQVESYNDPFGDEVEFERISYDEINFSLFTLSPRLCLIAVYDPPKSIKSLIDFLTSDSEVNVGYSNISIDINDFINVMRLEFNYRLVSISKVKVSNVHVNENSKANIEITSKVNALKDLQEYVETSDFKLDKLKGVYLNEDVKASFELSSSALCCVQNGEKDVFNEILSRLEIRKE